MVMFEEVAPWSGVELRIQPSSSLYWSRALSLAERADTKRKEDVQSIFELTKCHNIGLKGNLSKSRVSA